MHQIEVHEKTISKSLIKSIFESFVMCTLYESKYSIMDQVKFVERVFIKFEEIRSAYHIHFFKLFKGCVPHILLGPFLNTLYHT